METFSALLAICAGNLPAPGEFPTQRPVTRSFDVYFDLRPNKWLSKQSWGWWFETLSCSLWRHRNARSTWAQAPVQLTVCWSNSKFDKILQYSSSKCSLPITTNFCTYHNSVTDMTCARFRCDRLSTFQARALHNLTEFRIRPKCR